MNGRGFKKIPENIHVQEYCKFGTKYQECRKVFYTKKPDHQEPHLILKKLLNVPNLLNVPSKLFIKYSLTLKIRKFYLNFF